MTAAQRSLAGSGESMFLAHLDVIDRVTAFVAARNHLAAADADDFRSHVKLKLIEDDYAILIKFKGRSSLRTYLTVVIQRLFLDYRISAWGKWRPSAEAKRAGAVAMLLEQLQTRDGHTFEESCELLRAKHGVHASRAELEAIAARLPARIRKRFESDDVLETVADAGPSVDVLVVERERASTASQVDGALKAVMSSLDPQDRLILALRFEDGRTVADIAGLLRLDQKGLYRRLERLLAQLRTALEARGIQSSAVVEMFESPAVSIEWRADTTPEMPDVSPSIGKGAHEWR
jgi:RNA polymerase sigma factor (sigma-70 family)